MNKLTLKLNNHFSLFQKIIQIFNFCFQLFFDFLNCFIIIMKIIINKTIFNYIVIDIFLILMKNY